MPTVPIPRSPDQLSTRQRYERLRSQLWTERASFDAQYREIGQYLFPVRPRFMTTDRNRGDRRNQSIIDSTATFASQTLASGLHAGLTSPARPWMKLSVPDPALATSAPVKQWLHDVTERMHIVFQLSNLYNALPIVYKDMGVFGTAAMGVLDDPGSPGSSGDLFRCYPYPIGSYALGMDNRGLVTTFVRESIKTVGQLVEQFGGADGGSLKPGQTPDWARFSTGVKALWERADYEQPIEICWVVTPTRAYDRDALGPQGFPWSSCHFEKGGPSDTVLRESGFYEFPVLCPRWFANAEDTYGTDCPGMTALGDIKQLQSQQKVKGQAIQKLVNPPLQGSHELRTQKVSLLPGDLTYVSSLERGGVKPIHEVKPDLSHFVQDIQEVQYRIHRAFFVDVIQMIGFSDPSRGSQPVTAREVDERHEEKLLAFGPVLESTVDELLDPLVDRVFAMMSRAGLIPDPPEELQGIELTVEYTSIMAQAQKMVGVASVDRFLGAAAQLATVFPDARHKINAFAAIDDYADKLGVNPTLIRSDDDAGASLQQEQQAMQQQAQAEQAQKLGAGAKSLAGAPLNTGSALDAILSQQGGAA
jgi:hypothetical protein